METCNFDNIILNISAAPKISRDYNIRDIVGKVGEPFKITIPYNGNPIPTVAWTQVNITIQKFFLCITIINYLETPVRFLILENLRLKKCPDIRYIVSVFKH